MAANLIEAWHVSNEPLFADHRRVYFELRYKPPDLDPYRNPRKTDTTRYTEYLTKALSDTNMVNNTTLGITNIESN